MFPSLLPQTTRSTIKTAPKLDNFYNSVDSSAIPDMVAKYFPSSQKTQEYRLTDGMGSIQAVTQDNITHKNDINEMLINSGGSVT